ncbi:MAG: SMP-30/gluconolactonase/LRE family protein [Ilumatobacteraceae bacterium]
MTLTPELVQEGYLFPETPRWHSPSGSFYFVDIDRGEIHRWTPGGSARLCFRHSDWISGYAFGPDGEWVVTSARRRVLMRVTLGDTPDTAMVSDFAELSDVARFGINDILLAPGGITYVDTLCYNFLAGSEAKPSASPVVAVMPDGSYKVATDITSFPNGMALAPGSSTLLVADSLAQCIHAFETEPDGTLSNGRVWAAMPGEMPDGVSLDAEGGLWVATHHRVVRVVEGGEITDEVDMGPTRATACMLGGDDGRTLLITASDSHDRSIINKNPSGRIFSARVNVPGNSLPSLY